MSAVKMDGPCLYLRAYSCLEYLYCVIETPSDGRQVSHGKVNEICSGIVGQILDCWNKMPSNVVYTSNNWAIAYVAIEHSRSCVTCAGLPCTGFPKPRGSIICSGLLVVHA